MSKMPNNQIQVFPKREEKTPKIEMQRVKTSFSEFFPPVIPFILLSLLWLCFIPFSFGVIAGNLVSGMVAGYGLVISSIMAVALWDTKTAKWKTIAWALLLSMTLTALIAQGSYFSGKLLLVIIPTGLLVALRANRNFEKLILSARSRRYR